MAQKLQNDRIKPLINTTPTQIQWPSGSLVTIGGQQYAVGSVLTLNLSGLTANTLYMVYAVLVAGVVTLVSSTNVNSLGPAGHTRWKLIGAFYSSGTAVVEFGAFVNIEGEPATSARVTSLLTIGVDAGSAPASSAGTGKFDEATQWEWHRKGNLFIGYMKAYGALTSVGAGNTIWKFPLPAGFATVAGIHTGGNAQPHRGPHVGDGRALNNSVSGFWRDLVAMIYDTTNMYLFASRTTSGTNLDAMNSANFFSTSGFNDLQAKIEIPISGWSATPLKDL